MTEGDAAKFGYLEFGFDFRNSFQSRLTSSVEIIILGSYEVVPFSFR